MSYDKSLAILGICKVTVDGTDLGYSRGACSWTVQRVFHAIAANGDMGDTVNSEILDEERATLSLNQLIISAADFAKLYPAVSEASGVVTPTGAVADTTDYHTVVAVAKTKGGKYVRYTLNNAFVKSNIDWQFTERDEVVANIVYEACYAAKTDLWSYTAPYTIEFLDTLS